MNRIALVYSVTAAMVACGPAAPPKLAPPATPTEAAPAPPPPPPAQRKPRPARGWEWAVALTSSGTARATGVAADASGHLYVTGVFSGVMTLGATQLESEPHQRFLARLSADDGSAQWVHALGECDPLAPSSLALTPTGDVVVGGELAGRAVISAFAAADGKALWRQTLSSKQPVEVRGVAATPTGDLIVAGTLHADAALGGAKLFHIGKSDIFLLALAGADGAVQWAETVGNPENDSTRGVAVDDDGNAYVAGSFSGSLNVGDYWLEAPGEGSDVFIASLDGAGKVRWAHQLQVASVTMPWDLSVNASGDTAIVGVFRGETPINGQQATSAGGFDGFVATHGADGAPRWAAYRGGPHTDSWRTADYNLAGQLVITGTADVQKQAAGGLIRTGAGKVTVTVFSPLGDEEWTVAAPAGGQASPWAATVDPFGFVYVAGGFTESIDFGSHALRVEANTDAFVAKLRP